MTRYTTILSIFALFSLIGCSGVIDTTSGGCSNGCSSGETCQEQNDGSFQCVNNPGGDPCGGYCGTGQTCTTHSDGSSTCVSQNPGGGSCSNVTCNAGYHCEYGQCVENDPGNGNNGGGTTMPPANTTPVTFRVFTPGGQSMQRIDFNYCVSSTTTDPTQCYAWTEPGGVAENANYIDVVLHLPSSGVVRFNASYYANANQGPSNWLCFGSANPQLTAEVELYTPSATYYTDDIGRTAFSSGGCSAFVRIDDIL